MAFVVAASEPPPSPTELLEHCQQQLAYFAVPRYLEFVEDLPVTSNGKVQKYVLRERGLSATTYDREREGVHLRR